ncbi:MAG: complex I NDUFA9 subunit family protein [Rhodovibrionaceae bacterium]|nr:complex I NDUFA9 subunit family protein [Rhodovibrionaceae bacterium]
MKLVTVFGGTGYLGRRVAERFGEAGWSVRIAARHPPRQGQLPAHCTAQIADIRNARDVAVALEGAACAVNAVSAYVERGGISYEDVHVAGASLLAQACASAGLSALIHVSGIGADAGARSRYISARGRGEEAVRKIFPKATVLRPGAMMGGAGGLVAALDGIARLTPVVPLIGGGGTRLQPVHVEDVAIAALRSAGREGGRIYELGGADVVSLSEIVRRTLAFRNRRRLLLPVPFAMARALAVVGERLPGAPLTRAQVELLQDDNVVSKRMPGLAELGIEARGLEAALNELVGG